MTTSQRWPLHPRPIAGEALTSWLRRIATAHHLRLEELLMNGLGGYSFDLADRAGDLDIDPPAALLEAVSDHTSRDYDELRSMTLAGTIPWLLDSLEHSDDPIAFDTYVHQHQILITHRSRAHPLVTGWRAWSTPKPVNRACPICVEDAISGSAHTLLSTLPVTLSCPQHGCYLERVHGSHGPRLIWSDDQHQPRPAGIAVLAMDRRTHDAFLLDTVALPRRDVRAGVWFRLLRTLLDELQTPISYAPRHARTLRAIWSSIDLPPRGGQHGWRTYEQLEWALQQRLLEAAAAAMAMIQNGSIRAPGDGAALLLPPEHPARDRRGAEDTGRAVLESDTPANYWTAMVDSLNEVVTLARTDPATAEKLYRLVCCGPIGATEARQTLADLGIEFERELTSERTMAGSLPHEPAAGPATDRSR